MKKLLFLLFLCLIGGGVYLGFFRERPEELRFITVSLARSDVVTTVSATGTVEAVNTVTVGTQVSGTIQKILADYNSRVKKGDVITIIDPVLVQAEVAQKEAALGAARAAVREVQATLADAKRTLERQKKLYALQYIAESDLDSAQSAVDVAEAKLGSARAQAEQAQASLKYAKANLDNTRILSPVDGVVIGKDVSEGQTVAASYQTPTLFTIAEDLTKMEVQADVDEADIGAVAEGMEATFTVDAFPDEVFHAKVHQVRFLAVTVENVVTYPVVLRVDNPHLKLKPGMTANVSIETAAARNVLTVPAAALRFTPPEAFLHPEGAAGAADSSPSSAATGTGTASEKNRGSGGGTGSGKGAGPGSGSGKNADRAGGRVLWILEETSGNRPSLKAVPVRTGLSDGSKTVVSGDLREGQQVVTGTASGGSSGTSSNSAGTRQSTQPPMPRFF